MRCAIVACLICLGATAGAASETNWGTWAEEVRKGHPLAGDYYAVTAVGGGRGRTRFPPFHRGPALRPEPDPQPYVLLLGEVHDNPAHHQVRAWLVENAAKISPNWRPAIVFEQIRVDQQPVVDKFAALAEAGSGSTTSDDLFRLLEWDKSGWPPAAIYKPLFDAAIAAKLPIYAGDPPRARVRGVARGDFSLAPEDRARLRLDEPMPGALLDVLRKDLVDSHCGVLPPEAISGMASAQRYRDAHLADVLLAAAEQHGSAILIAGNGHVRSDRGVPWHLRQRAPQTKVASLMIVEVEEGKTDPASYVPRDPEGKPAADALIFTPRAERADPCEGMRKMKR